MSNQKFKLKSTFSPKGDQPQAIKELTAKFTNGERYATLLGVTGSGKTFTMANVIQNLNKPTLILCHNKTLAAQLYGEFKQFFPENAVEYFVSYYDYYQPEAYIPGRDIYIEKDSSINERIEMLRLHTTMSLFERRDVIVVASVSCIYGLGMPEEYFKAVVEISTGQCMERDQLITKLIDSHYTRNDFEFVRGGIRVKGDTVEIYPAYLENSVRVEFDFDQISKISRINPLDNRILEEVTSIPIYPANHFITNSEQQERAINSIQAELKNRIEYFEKHNKILEAQRVEQRTNFDLEMIKEIGYCSGIENYSYHLTGGKAGRTPVCLLDYFPDDFLTIIDESHVSVPQIRAMYGGDFARKKNLVEHGFRLPCAFDNRPLKFKEFEEKTKRTLFVSATPADYELAKTDGEITEQVVRPTGLLDPRIIISPISNQVDDLLERLRQTIAKEEVALVATLTQKMSEDLTDYLKKAGIKAEYMHSKTKTTERTQIIRRLRLKQIDVIVGVNLLREGLDMPEVSLVAILDADKTGFLRSQRALIQTAGRAARNVGGQVIFYADEISDAIAKTVEETDRRREKQIEYNIKHNVTPKTIAKSMQEILDATKVAQEVEKSKSPTIDDYLKVNSSETAIEVLKREMLSAAKALDFEKAAIIKEKLLDIGADLTEKF